MICLVFAENKYLAQQKGQKEHFLLSRFLLSTVRQENKSEPIQALEEIIPPRMNRGFSDVGQFPFFTQGPQQ